MTEPRSRWCIRCSCGWTSDFSQRWAAESAAKLHPKLGASGTEHIITIRGTAG